MDRLIPVTFRFHSVLAPAAQRVSLLGPFNNWTPNVHPLKRTGNGWWIVTVYFPPRGRIVYCFDVDGTIWLDPNDQGRIPNDWGSEHSVRNVPETPSTLHPPKLLAPIQGGAQILEWTTEGTPEAIVLRPSGEVDIATVSLFGDPLTEAVKANSRVIVDMSAIQYIDSTGVNALVQVHKLSQERGHHFVLVVPPGIVQEVLSLMDIGKVIPIFPKLQDAVTSFSSSSTHKEA
jgi:anti-sigma B factor antagonist